VFWQKPFFFVCSKKLIIENFMILVATKNGRTKILSPFSFGDVVGFGIRER
jgi:hypothetical protein